MKGVRVKRFVIASVGLVGLGMIVLLMPMASRRTTASHLTVGEKTDMAQPRPSASDRTKANTGSLDERGEGSQTEAESSVDAFDGLTDKWLKPSKTGVSMSDVDGFVKAFRKVPKTRRNECIHRALNLIPDENVMLLTGVLMDRRMDKEIVKTVFADILNRSDEVKKPILQEILKDKTHPCRSDAEWIFEVTGEKPE